MARERAEAERRARVEAVQEAHIEQQRREFEAQKAQEQRRRLQARAESIAATQGSGEATMAAPTVTTVVRRSACVRCREHLNNPIGCVAQASSKATACARCQAARKSCSWSTAGKAAEASTPAGSATEGSGKPVEKCATKRRSRTATNTSPRGGEKRKKTCTTTEEGEDEEEMFGVPKAMAEEQRDALGMLTQSLAQLSERLAASEVREVERLEIERERLALERRRCESKCGFGSE